MGRKCVRQTESTDVWHTPICSISSPGQHSVCLYTLLSLIAANGCFETQHHASWHGLRRIYTTSVSDDRHAFLDIRYNASNGVDHATRKKALITSGKTSPHNLEQLEKIISYLEYLPTLYLIMYPPFSIRCNYI